MAERITTTDELLHADFERVELAEVQLRKPEPGHQVAGRVLDRWNNQDLRLRWNGHEYEVTVASDWTLERFQPVRSPVEKTMIQQQWGEA